MLNKHSQYRILSWDELTELIRSLKERVISSDLPIQFGILPLNPKSLIAAAMLAEALGTRVVSSHDGVTFDLFSDQAPKISLFFYDHTDGQNRRENVYAEEIFDNGGFRQIVTFPWNNL